MKLIVEDLGFAYEERSIIQHIHMSVEVGEFVSILGPSGSGKSTILNLLAGLIKPKAGNIYVDGKKVEGISSHFAYMPQEDLLFPWQTILDNVCLYGKIHRHFEEAKKKALEYLPIFGLEGCEKAYPSQLSGGMRQRAAFLRTALCKADILLLDEPFGALDVISRGEMQDWLAHMRQRLGRTTLLVTHDIDEAIYLSDRILILAGSPAQIIKEIRITEKQSRTREWLYEQGSLRTQIYKEIKGEAK